jgi:hypothetical protein
VTFRGDEIAKALRSLSKLILHPLIYTLLEFTLVQDTERCPGTIGAEKKEAPTAPDFNSQWGHFDLTHASLQSTWVFPQSSDC